MAALFDIEKCVQAYVSRAIIFVDTRTTLTESLYILRIMRMVTQFLTLKHTRTPVWKYVAHTAMSCFLLGQVTSSSTYSPPFYLMMEAFQQHSVCSVVTYPRELLRWSHGNRHTQCGMTVRKSGNIWENCDILFNTRPLPCCTPTESVKMSCLPAYRKEKSGQS